MSALTAPRRQFVMILLQQIEATTSPIRE